MTDYFKDICDWQDENERFQPKTYVEYDDVLEYKGTRYRYHYTERDWNVLNHTKEQNLAMGRICVIQVNKEDMPVKAENVFPCTVVHGPSLEKTLEHLKIMLDIYLEMKDLTRPEFDAWRQKSS